MSYATYDAKYGDLDPFSEPIKRRPREPWELSDGEIDALEEDLCEHGWSWGLEIDAISEAAERRRNEAWAAAKERRHTKTALMHDFVDRGLSGYSGKRPSKSAAVVWLFLLRVADKNGVVRGWSVKDISEGVGVSLPTTRKAIQELSPAWLYCKPSEGETTVYRLRTDDE